MAERRLVYIAHALSGGSAGWDANIADARLWVAAAARLGWAPLAPYLAFDGTFDDADPRDREIGLEVDLAVLRVCAEVWLCGETISSGMKVEAGAADAARIPVRMLWSKEMIPVVKP